MPALTRRSFLTAAGAAAALPAAPLPNIVYVLADDLGWGDLACYNRESQIPTPHAGRIAREGVRFTDMHSPSAVCTPTRYGILTGRYCWRTTLREGVLWGRSGNLIEPGRTTVPALLKSRGYYTAGVGKWHLGLGDGEHADFTRPLRPGPVDHGFDEYFGIPASLDMEPYFYFENDRPVEPATAMTEGSHEPRGVFWRAGPIAPQMKLESVLDTLAERATAIIRQRTQPLFLYLALTSPHTPWLPGAKFRGVSQAGDYGDFVAHTDDVLGRVLRALDETGRASNTLVVFTSDNGADWTDDDMRRFPRHRSNAHWRGLKRDPYEGGHRVPFLARWPGHVRAGSVSNALGCLTDLMATAAEMTGAPPAGEDSFSLLPALAGKKPAREAVVHHAMDGTFAIRRGRWKLIETQPAQLYDLERDPGETVNLWRREPEIASGLQALLNRVRDAGRSRVAIE